MLPDSPQYKAMSAVNELQFAYTTDTSAISKSLNMQQRKPLPAASERLRSAQAITVGTLFTLLTYLRQRAVRSMYPTGKISKSKERLKICFSNG